MASTSPDASPSSSTCSSVSIAPPRYSTEELRSARSSLPPTSDTLPKLPYFVDRGSLHTFYNSANPRPEGEERKPDDYVIYHFDELKKISRGPLSRRRPSAGVHPLVDNGQTNMKPRHDLDPLIPTISLPANHSNRRNSDFHPLPAPPSSLQPQSASGHLGATASSYSALPNLRLDPTAATDSSAQAFPSLPSSNETPPDGSPSGPGGTAAASKLLQAALRVNSRATSSGPRKKDGLLGAQPAGGTFSGGTPALLPCPVEGFGGSGRGRGGIGRGGRAAEKREKSPGDGEGGKGRGQEDRRPSLVGPPPTEGRKGGATSAVWQRVDRSADARLSFLLCISGERQAATGPDSMTPRSDNVQRRASPMVKRKDEKPMWMTGWPPPAAGSKKDLWDTPEKAADRPSGIFSLGSLRRCEQAVSQGKDLNAYILEATTGYKKRVSDEEDQHNEAREGRIPTAETGEEEKHETDREPAANFKFNVSSRFFEEEEDGLSNGGSKFLRTIIGAGNNDPNGSVEDQLPSPISETFVKTTAPTVLGGGDHLASSGSETQEGDSFPQYHHTSTPPSMWPASKDSKPTDGEGRESVRLGEEDGRRAGRFLLDMLNAGPPPEASHPPIGHPDMSPAMYTSQAPAHPAPQQDRIDVAQLFQQHALCSSQSSSQLPPASFPQRFSLGGPSYPDCPEINDPVHMQPPPPSFPPPSLDQAPRRVPPTYMSQSTGGCSPDQYPMSLSPMLHQQANLPPPMPPRPYAFLGNPHGQPPPPRGPRPMRLKGGNVPGHPSGLLSEVFLGMESPQGPTPSFPRPPVDSSMYSGQMFLDSHNEQHSTGVVKQPLYRGGGPQGFMGSLDNGSSRVTTTPSSTYCSSSMYPGYPIQQPDYQASPSRTVAGHMEPCASSAHHNPSIDNRRWQQRNSHSTEMALAQFGSPFSSCSAVDTTPARLQNASPPSQGSQDWPSTNQGGPVLPADVQNMGSEVNSSQREERSQATAGTENDIVSQCLEIFLAKKHG
eukprot:GHVS01037458.1.p1 GENE.GHVS01037458.1~~GHVS01037458.1.p1  ORF type:complete len:1034 (-),score=169.33 GHVS01037458.1:348-3356(-)